MSSKLARIYIIMITEKKRIELLAPAKNLECGIEAINHGADAVYIGAPRFGARASAVNSLEDIAELVSYAHLFNAKVYVAINTILTDDELKETEDMIHKLYHIGADAIIIQDFGITKLNLPPIALHSSTQMDNRTPEKVEFLHTAGFEQVVLARELTLKQIKDIHAAVPDVKLEVFVHGALCVSYSGQCYVSHHCTGRSANRGECSQFCRLPFNLIDSDGKIIAQDKHLLSLKDLNQIQELEKIIDAGATSLKIEGRLKDVSYVKNVTSAYRKKLDEIFARRDEYTRASSGRVELNFEPELEKTFSRGFTNYFLRGREQGIYSFDTPKSLGEEIGVVKESRGLQHIISGVKQLNNGDGLCFVDSQGKMKGFRVNKVEGNKVFTTERLSIPAKAIIYRNYNHEFDKILSKESAVRRMSVSLSLYDNEAGYVLSATDEDNNRVEVITTCNKEIAKTDQTENIKKQLSKLGGTPFYMSDLQINLSNNWFIPSSILADMRRMAIEKLIGERRNNYKRNEYTFKQTEHAFPEKKVNYLANVMNSKSALFYRQHGTEIVGLAYEKQPIPNAVLMFCKHCLRFSMGWCPIRQRVKSPYKEPYFLVDREGRRFRLDFDCKNCVMKVVEA